MRPMIFDTQGTGFYKRAARQMMAQKEITFLGDVGRSGLGDEIMLLEGLEDFGSMYPHGYDDGPARTYTMPTMDRGTLYDFSTGPVSTGMSGARLGASVGSNQGAWPRIADPRWRYTGLDGGWPKQESRYSNPKFRFTGPSLTGLRGANIRRGRYAYTGLQGGFGDAQSDARTAMSTAQTIRDTGMAACSLITNTADKARCEAGVTAAYSAARTAIVAGYGTDGTYAPSGGSSATPQATPEQIAEKLRQQAAQTGVTPPAEIVDSGISTTTMIAGGILAVALVAGVYIATRPPQHAY